jgi:hypothetical protein
MSSEDKTYLDLGPFFPKRPVGTEPARDDTSNRGDMVSGDSKGGYSTPSGEQVPSRPAVGQIADTTTDLPTGPTNPTDVAQ